MCFETLFGKYQLKGKKSNNVGSLLCRNDVDGIFCPYMFFSFAINSTESLEPLRSGLKYPFVLARGASFLSATVAFLHPDTC